MSLGTPEACQAFNDAFILGNPLPAIQAAQKVLDNIKDAADVNIVKGVNCQVRGPHVPLQQQPLACLLAYTPCRGIAIRCSRSLRAAACVSNK